MIFLIRHAQSCYNKSVLELQEKLGKNYMKQQQYLNEKFNLKFQDVDISQQGIKQAKQCNLKMKQKQIDLVIVSPMRRALQTAKIIFQKHPSKPLMIVNRYFREVLESSNDIGNRLRQSMKDYPEFDYSSMQGDQDTWYLQTIQCAQIRQQLLKQLSQTKQNHRDAATRIALNFIKRWWFKRVQNPNNDSLEQRVLPDMKVQKQILKQYCKKYQSIAVVTHSRNLKNYLGRKVNNCQICEYSVDKLMQQK